MFKSDERVKLENDNPVNRCKPETKGDACTCNPVKNGKIMTEDEKKREIRFRKFS